MNDRADHDGGNDDDHNPDPSRHDNDEDWLWTLIIIMMIDDWNDNDNNDDHNDDNDDSDEWSKGWWPSSDLWFYKGAPRPPQTPFDRQIKEFLAQAR